MKHFIYTFREQTPRNGHTIKTVRIYHVYRNIPKLVAQGSDTFVSEFQLVMMTLEDNEQLPPPAFVKGNGGGHMYHTADMLEDAGFAKITKVE